MPALLTSPKSFLGPSAWATCAAPAFTPASSATSKISGVTASPNSCVKLSASACLRTLANTLAPWRTACATAARPMPVEAPVTTTARLISAAMCSLRLFESVCHTALGEVVGRHLDQHLVARQHANAVFAHLAGGVADDLVAVFEFDPERRVGQKLHHG